MKHPATIASLLSILLVVSACESGPKGSEGGESADESAAETEADDQEESSRDDSPATDGDATDTEEETMKLTSNAFNDAGPIPEKLTCAGEGQSPPLSWEGAPDGTKSFVILLEDPDAPNGTFKHWAVWNLPPDETSLNAGAASDESLDQAVNDFDDRGYGPPCPPPSDDAHRYNFYVWALGVETLDLGDSPHYDDVKAAASEHKLAGAAMTGTFGR